MELETISGWVDADRYPDELILLALKEAVFAGKLHFRYIDRILLEWSRNRCVPHRMPKPIRRNLEISEDRSEARPLRACFCA